MIPMNTMMYVSERGDDTATSLRMSAPISPEASASPTPIMTMRMMPMAVKPMKLLTNDVKR